MVLQAAAVHVHGEHDYRSKLQRYQTTRHCMLLLSNSPKTASTNREAESLTVHDSPFYPTNTTTKVKAFHSPKLQLDPIRSVTLLESHLYTYLETKKCLLLSQLDRRRNEIPAVRVVVLVLFKWSWSRSNLTRPACKLAVYREMWKGP